MADFPRKIAGIGTDIVELARVRNIRFLRRFAEYFLVPGELEAFEKDSDPIGFVASRFAAKEAVIKAFPGPLSPHEFEIQKDGPKPTVHFHSKENDGRYGALVSMSHSTDYAVGYATVIDRSLLP